MQFLFTDLHLHSILSDEDLCDETPEHILTKVQGYVDKYNKENGTNVKCCISIADHNSTLSAIEVQKLLKTGKFNGVSYINGCEFTTDLSEMSAYVGTNRLFTRCHLLAYGYSPTDKELIAYSKITHKHFSNEDNIGFQICSARRAVCEKYNIKIPFSYLEGLTNLKQHENYTQEFLKLMRAYFKENNLSYNENEVYDAIRPYLIGANTYCQDATSFGRIKLSEAMELTHNAGGKVVLAHPTTLSVLSGGIKDILREAGYSEEYINANFKKNGTRVQLMSVKREVAEVVLKKFIDVANVIGNGVKIEGLETFNSINFDRRKDIAIGNVCHERNLFETAGSDYHGENFTTHKQIGNVITEAAQKEFGIQHNRWQDRRLFMRISELPFVNAVFKQKNLGSLTIIDEKMQKLEWRDVSQIIDSSIVKKRKALDERESNAQKIQKGNENLPYHTAEIRKRITMLTQIAESFSKVLNKNLRVAERRKMVVKLDSFCRSILKSITILQKSIRNHSEYYDVQDVKKLTTLLKEIHRKYYELLRLDNGIMLDLKTNIKNKYNVKDTSIDKLAHITIKEDPNGKEK